MTIPSIWVAFALSLLIHIAVLWQWLPQLRVHPPSPDEAKPGEASGSLIVRLMPPPSPPPGPPPSPRQPLPAPPVRARPPVVTGRPRPAPPVIAFNRPRPEVPAPPPIGPAPARPPADDDLASYVETRRRARAQPAPAPASAETAAIAQPAEDDKARSDRIVAANLGAQRAQTFGYDPKQGGGVFQITRVGYDIAEFAFYGWHKEFRRNTKQLIEVRKGDNSDIRIAIVRKMISIIREYEQEDFTWESQRLGRTLSLSARARDNAGLEEFMMREFYFDSRAPAR